MPYAVLDAADEKNRQGSSIPLRPDLALELSTWMAERLALLQDECRAWGEPIPARLPADTRLFNMPSGLTRIFDRDLAVAGISKRDQRNRVVDIHALRVTFGTHLCAAGVPLRTAQAAMRHSKPELTANIYTDPKLLDVAGALAALPSLTNETAAQATACTRASAQTARDAAWTLAGLDRLGSAASSPDGLMPNPPAWTKHRRHPFCQFCPFRFEGMRGARLPWKDPSVSSVSALLEWNLRARVLGGAPLFTSREAPHDADRTRPARFAPCVRARCSTSPPTEPSTYARPR